MDTNILPIGSIIKVYNNDSAYIILGQFNKIDEKMYTYYCCKYPYGLTINDYRMENRLDKYEIYINHEDIEAIISLGNVNREV